MAMELTQWKYRGTCDEARLRVLQGTIPFEDIVGRLDHEMHLVCCHTPECHDKQGYKRTVYCAEVAHQLFDIFFNSQSGYRGAYFQSPERGLAANSLMLRTVVPRLIAWTRAHCAEQDPEFAAKSLLATSAKAWLAEETLCLCERCEGEWNTTTQADLQIVNGRWECDSHMHALWGQQAPWFKKIRFIGAFLNDSGDEYVAPHKGLRAAEINARGWS